MLSVWLCLRFCIIKSLILCYYKTSRSNHRLKIYYDHDILPFSVDYYIMNQMLNVWLCLRFGVIKILILSYYKNELVG